MQDLHATGDFVVDSLSQPQNSFRRPNTPICIQYLQNTLYSLQSQKHLLSFIKQTKAMLQSMVQKHSLHAKRVSLLVKHKGKNSLLDSWCNWNLHTRGKQWAGMETNMQENVYLRWYGDELFEVDWRDLSELTNLQRSRKSQIQKQDVQHLTAMKVNDLYRDVTHSCKQWKYESFYLSKMTKVNLCKIKKMVNNTFLSVNFECIPPHVTM